MGSGAQDVRPLTLPKDPLPTVDAIVAIGHPINYLRDADAVDQALIAIAGAPRPGGQLAFDVCDLTWGRARQDAPTFATTGYDWAISTEFSLPARTASSGTSDLPGQ